MRNKHNCLYIKELQLVLEKNSFFYLLAMGGFFARFVECSCPILTFTVFHVACNCKAVCGHHTGQHCPPRRHLPT